MTDETVPSGGAPRHNSPSDLPSCALAEVLSWSPTQVLRALKYQADHQLTGAIIERLTAMRTMDFAAALLVDRAYRAQGWQVTARALLDACYRALGLLEAPPLALGYLATAHKHVGAPSLKWDALAFYSETLRDKRQPLTVHAAAQIGLLALHLAGEQEPGDQARMAFALLFDLAPPERRLTVLAEALAVLESALGGRQIDAAQLEALAMRSDTMEPEAGFYGLPGVLVEVRSWSPAQVLRALAVEADAGVAWQPGELLRWADLGGIDFAVGRLLARVEEAHTEEAARRLLWEGRSLAFRELGIDVEEEQPSEAIATYGAEYAGRLFARMLARVEGGRALLMGVLSRMEAQAMALGGNGGAGAPASA